MVAQARIFLPVYPRIPSQRSWSDVAFDYIEGLSRTSLAFLCLALSRMADLRPGSRWHPFADYFTGSLDEKFVNVIVGVNPTETLHHHEVFEDAIEQLTAKAEPDFARLFTVGPPNVAILGAWPRPLDDHEVKALAHYDALIVPTTEDLSAVPRQAIERGAAFVIPPTQPEDLAKVLKGLLHAR